MINKNFMYLVGIAIILVFGIFLLSNNGRAEIQGEAILEGEVKIVKLYVGSNGDYVLEPSELNKGKRVRLEADMSRMPGCSKSIMIPAFGVSKTFTTNNNYVEFTPDKSGTFNIACSMNMYRGTFSVLESDGSKSSYVEQKLSASKVGGCGMGSGCGCGR